MAGKVLDIDTIIEKDDLGCSLANMYQEWETRRAKRVSEWKEIQQYIFSIDTTTTTNAKLPWKNKTVTPKLTQIRDNLFANYMAAVFPKRKWLYWEGDTENDNDDEKRSAVRAYMAHCIEQPQFKNIIRKLMYDYIDYGNCIGTVEWIDKRQDTPTGPKAGYVGPMPVRISPLDAVVNPVADDFDNAPKIFRSLLTVGEVKAMLESLSTPDLDAKQVFDYCMRLRQQSYQHAGSFTTKNEFFNIAGFDSYTGYLHSNYMELLTCYGDFYDVHNDKFYKNAKIVVVDRHKVISIETDPAKLDTIPIYHVGWRMRQDNIWAQGPLDNLVGLQYRIDHLENLKADVFDLIAAPPLKIKGLVGDFRWEPFARLEVGDDGDVEVLAPDVNALQANMEIANLMNLMEEMAGSPKEAAGFRTPGEKTAYEVQRLENAANRIFYNKIAQFEEFLEKLLNAMLELARRKIDQSILVKTLDDELKTAAFMEITPDDLSANGRIKPVAARNFAERAEVVQNLTNFYASAVGADPDIKAHFSSVKLAKMFEDLLDLQDFEVVVPYIRLTEQGEAQKLLNTAQEDVAATAMAPSGMTPDDTGPL